MQYNPTFTAKSLAGPRSRAWVGERGLTLIEDPEDDSILFPEPPTPPPPTTTLCCLPIEEIESDTGECSAIGREAI